MRASPNELIGLRTQDRVDAFVNTAALSYFGFAGISSLHHRAYGVISTYLDNDATREDLKSFVVNGCLRAAIWNTLQAVQSDTEAYLGYDLSAREHMVEMTLPRTPRFQLPHPGVISVNTRTVWTNVTALTAVPVTPYIIPSVSMVFNGGSWYAQVPVSVVRNPTTLFLRNPADNGAYHINALQQGFPRKVGANWEIPILQSKTPYDGVSAVAVQDKDIARITIAMPVIPAGSQLLPVYPGTHQVIPHRSVIVNNDSTVTYELYVYALVDPEFLDGPVNLVQSNAEFFKLFSEISFAYKTITPAYPELHVTNDCGETSVYRYDPLVPANKQFPSVRLIEQGYGVVGLCADNIFVSDCDAFVRAFGAYDVNARSYVLRMWYTTDPSVLPPLYANQIPSAVRAGYAKVAADLPLRDCQCDTKVGYIASMQAAYGTEYVNPTTQVQIFKSEFGQLHGQVLYKNVIDQLRCYRRPILFSMSPGV